MASLLVSGHRSSCMGKGNIGDKVGERHSWTGARHGWFDSFFLRGVGVVGDEDGITFGGPHCMISKCRFDAESHVCHVYRLYKCYCLGVPSRPFSEACTVKTYSIAQLAATIARTRDDSSRGATNSQQLLYHRTLEGPLFLL